MEKRRRLTNIYKLDNMSYEEYAKESQDIKEKLAELRIPEVDQAIVAGEFLDNMGDAWPSISLDERHDALRFSVLRVYVDALSGRLVGFTPRPAFWPVFEEARSRNPQVLLLKPDEVKQRLAELQAVRMVWWRRGRIELAPSRR